MSAKNGSIKLVAGNSNPALAQDIAKGLDMQLTKAVVRRFADMKIFVEIQENVRGSDAFIIQSTSFPANDHLMELLIITDALRRSSARRITAVIPYFGYARQDRKIGSRTPISATRGQSDHAGRCRPRGMTVDCMPSRSRAFSTSRPTISSPRRSWCATSRSASTSPTSWWCRPTSAAWCARAGSPSASTRRSPSSTSAASAPAKSEVMNVIGDCAGYTCILVDDIVDFGGTLVNAAEALLANGAKDVYAYISHGVLSGGAAARIIGSRLKELVITEIILPTEAVQKAKNIRTLSIAPLIAEAIARTASEELGCRDLFD